MYCPLFLPFAGGGRMSSMLCVCNPVMPVHGKPSWVYLMVLKTIQFSYTIQFVKRLPRFNCGLCAVHQRDVYIQESKTFLRKVRQIIANGKSQTGFYSSYFLVPKKSDLFKKFRWRHKVDVSQIVVLPVKTNWFMIYYWFITKSRIQHFSALGRR